MSSISVSIQSMNSDTKKPKRIIEIVSAPIKCDRRAQEARQFQNSQAELVASFFEKKDAFVLLRPRL